MNTVTAVAGYGGSAATRVKQIPLALTAAPAMTAGAWSSEPFAAFRANRKSACGPASRMMRRRYSGSVPRNAGNTNTRCTCDSPRSRSGARTPPVRTGRDHGVLQLPTTVFFAVRELHNVMVQLPRRANRLYHILQGVGSRSRRSAQTNVCVALAKVAVLSEAPCLSGSHKNKVSN